MPDYLAHHARSLGDREAFWLEQAALIDWDDEPQTACDDNRRPFARWFPDGTLNLCHNAVDRWAAIDPAEPALIHVSTETGAERIFSRAELLAEVNRWAAALRGSAVGIGDRVLIYLPMIPEAVFAMLACVRIGAVHSVVFGGFGGRALAARIDDAAPRIIIAADAGSRGGRVIPYKPLLENALAVAAHRPQAVIIVDRGLCPSELGEGQLDAATWLAPHAGTIIDPVSLPADHPSYILYTSGTTGNPKGVQRDTAGYAVALAASMRHIFLARPGAAFFAASDIGWVVGHSYAVYGPLLAGMATVIYEGTPLNPDPGILWRIAARHRVRTMFTAPTTLRMLRRANLPIRDAHDLSELNALFVAGEPLDEATSRWIDAELPAAILDNYWQTETGWPILATCRGLGGTPPPPGSAGRPVYGYDIRLVDPETGAEAPAGQKGVLVIAQPLPPGVASTIWRDDARFVRTYFNALPGSLDHYSTFDWAMRDDQGYVYILGRSDDVINVAGHRLGTREIEESLCGDARVSEAAVIGVRDPLRNQVPVAFVVLRLGEAQDESVRSALLDKVTREIGGIARPAAVHFVEALPKTRSGKVLRRAVQAVCEGDDPGDLSTIDDPVALDRIRDLVSSRRARLRDREIP